MSFVEGEGSRGFSCLVDVLLLGALCKSLRKEDDSTPREGLPSPGLTSMKFSL